jgi:hypothetical protein
MRTALGVLIVVGVFAGFSIAARAEQTWKGAISDSNCNGKHQASEHDGKKMTDADCTAVCIKKGAKYVFVSEGNVFKIANQRSKAIARHAGQRVELTGTLESDTITAKTVQAVTK